MELLKQFKEKCCLKGILKDATSSDRDGIRKKQNINTSNRLILVSAVFLAIGLVFLINDLATGFYNKAFTEYNLASVIIIIVSSFFALLYSTLTKKRDSNVAQYVAFAYSLLMVLAMDLFLVSDLLVGRGDYLIVFYNFILLNLVPIYVFPLSMSFDALTLLGVYLSIGLLNHTNRLSAFQQSSIIILSVIAAQQYLRVVKTKGMLQQIKLENMSKELEVISTIDFLTKLSNRTGLDHFLNQEVSQAIKDGKFVSVSMLDIDDFKTYNDYYSHMSGDVCLRKIGIEIQRVLPEKFHAFRYGGEEFLVVGIDCSDEELDLVDSAILTGVQELHINRKEVRSVEDFVTVSIGSSKGLIKSIGDFMNLLKLADDRLYKSKKTGKNKITNK